MKDRFEDLPETCNEMVLLPNVPDFCPSHGHTTQVHQRVTARCGCLKKEKNTRTKGGILRSHTTRRHVNPPGGLMQNARFLPRRGILLFPINVKGIIAFA